MLGSQAELAEQCLDLAAGVQRHRPTIAEEANTSQQADQDRALDRLDGRDSAKLRGVLGCEPSPVGTHALLPTMPPRTACRPAEHGTSPRARQEPAGVRPRI